MGRKLLTAAEIQALNPISRDSFLTQIAQAGSVGARQIWVRNPNISKDMLEDPDLNDHSRPSLRIEVQRLLTARGWTWYHTKDSRGSKKGFLDIWAARESDDRIIHLELKRTGKGMTESQRALFEMLERMHREVYLIRPADWGHLVEVVW